MEIRWGMVGCGDVAERKGGPALYRVPGSRLEAVMSRREARAADFARRHGVARYCTDVEQLLEDDEIDAVYIATPPHVHAELTEQAARAGKHVLCEKPMALTVADGERMVDVCRAHGVQLMIAYYRRFWPVVRTMKRLVDEGAIGRVLRARAQVASPYAPDEVGERAWLVRPEIAGGGFLTDVATHRLDLFAYFLGPPRDVAAVIDTQHLDIPVDDASSVALRFGGGGHATGAFSWNVGVPIDEFELCGTGGRLLARDLGRGVLEVHTSDGTSTLHLPPPDVTHVGLVEHFVACLREGAPNACSGVDGLHAVRMTEAAYQSEREGRRVRC